MSLFKPLAPLAASVLVLAQPVFAATPASDFAARAAVINLFEIRSSELAGARSRDGDIRNLAKQILADHQKAGEALNQAAQSAGVAPLPTALDAAHQSRLDALSGAPDKRFDRLYLEAQDESHAEALGLFSDYAKSGAQGPLQAFAASSLPALQAHLTHIQDFTVPRH